MTYAYSPSNSISTKRLATFQRHKDGKHKVLTINLDKVDSRNKTPIFSSQSSTNPSSIISPASSYHNHQSLYSATTITKCNFDTISWSNTSKQESSFTKTPPLTSLTDPISRSPSPLPFINLNRIEHPKLDALNTRKTLLYTLLTAFNKNDHETLISSYDALNQFILEKQSPDEFAYIHQRYKPALINAGIAKLKQEIDRERYVNTQSETLFNKDLLVNFFSVPRQQEEIREFIHLYGYLCNQINQFMLQLEKPLNQQELRNRYYNLAIEAINKLETTANTDSSGIGIAIKKTAKNYKKKLSHIIAHVPSIAFKNAMQNQQITTTNQTEPTCEANTFLIKSNKELDQLITTIQEKNSIHLDLLNNLIIAINKLITTPITNPNYYTYHALAMTHIDTLNQRHNTPKNHLINQLITQLTAIANKKINSSSRYFEMETIKNKVKDDLLTYLNSTSPYNRLSLSDKTTIIKTFLNKEQVNYIKPTIVMIDNPNRAIKPDAKYVFAKWIQSDPSEIIKDIITTQIKEIESQLNRNKKSILRHFKLRSKKGKNTQKVVLKKLYEVQLSLTPNTIEKKNILSQLKKRFRHY